MRWNEERTRPRFRARQGLAPWALLGTMAALACGRSPVAYEGDSFLGGAAASGGSSATGGSRTGGTGATGSGGTGSAVGGSVNLGGSGNVSGSGGSPGAAGANAGPYACPEVPATCTSFDDFPTDPGVTWGSGSFTGGIVVTGANLSRVPDTAELHVTGIVSGYGYGFQLYFSRCSDISSAKGIEFTLRGTTGDASLVTFQALTNADYPWQPSPQDGKGACTATDPANAWLECLAPGLTLPILDGPLLVEWKSMSGGTPVPWDAVASPKEIVGLQWLFPWDNSSKPYAVDVSLDDVLLWGALGGDCVPTLGTGGMGGTAGSGTAGSGVSGFGGVNQAGSSGAGSSGIGEGGGAGAGEGGASSELAGHGGA